MPLLNFLCRIIPLGHNYSFDKEFLRQWLGVMTYDQIFHFLERDTMRVALYMNDRAAVKGQAVPFGQVNLERVARALNIGYDGLHNSLIDCKITADIYREMCNFGLFGI